MTTPAAPSPDADERKGAVEQDSRDHETNTSMNGQMQHRKGSPLADSMDSDFPEPGGSPEHTGQLGGSEEQGSRQLNPDPQGQTRERVDREDSPPEPNPEAEQQDQDPGQRQKRNQGDKKDDSLAA